MPVLNYKVHHGTGAYDGPKLSMAWGPDLSGSLGGLGGAGGIGGLAIFSDDAAPDEGYPSPGPLMPLYDGNGNVMRLVDEDAEIKASYEYGPFGEVKELSGQEGQRNPFRWSTKWTDSESGMVYYGYRYYSASTGRWLNRDPMGEHGGIGLQTFVGNTPARAIDPVGLRQFANLQYCDSRCNFPALLPTQSESSWRDQTHVEAGLTGGWAGSASWTGLSRNPSTGFVTKELARIYAYYGSLYFEDPDLLWAGAASTVGLGLIPGIESLDYMWRTRLNGPGGEIRRIRWMMVGVAQAIFDDMAWQHRAYINQGLPELRAQLDVYAGRDRSARNRLFYRGWCRIAQGGRNNLMQGMIEVARYEQLVVAQPIFDERQPTSFYGQFVLSLMDHFAIPIIPGSVGFYTINPDGRFTNGNDRFEWMRDYVLTPWGQLGAPDQVYTVSFAMETYLWWITTR